MFKLYSKYNLQIFLLLITTTFSNATYAQAWIKDYVSLSVQQPNEKLKLHVMVATKDYGALVTINNYSNDVHLCSKTKPQYLGEQKIYDAEIALINGQYVKMIGMCVAYSGGFGSSEMVWDLEVQPDTQAGADYVINELLNGRDLEMKFESRFLSHLNHSFASKGFSGLYLPMLNAL